MKYFLRVLLALSLAPWSPIASSQLDTPFEIQWSDGQSSMGQFIRPGETFEFGFNVYGGIQPYRRAYIEGTFSNGTRPVVDLNQRVVSCDNDARCKVPELFRSGQFNLYVEDNAGNISFPALLSFWSYPIEVSSVLPTTALVNQKTLFRIKGENLPSTLAAYIPDCRNVQFTQRGDSEQAFTCTPESAGEKAGIIKESKNGPELYRFAVNVVEHGQCGTEHGKIYAHNAAGWNTDTFCFSGLSQPVSPVFPNQGQSTPWYCLGLNGGDNASCWARRLPAPVHGVCGQENGNNYSHDTNDWSTSDFCSSGYTSPPNPSFPNANRSTSWQCVGQNGGTTATCSANRNPIPINGICGQEHSKSYPHDASRWSSTDFCASGNASPENPAFPPADGSASWQCVGQNGGNTVSCSAGRGPAPIDGACGEQNTKAYPHDATDWSSEAFCSAGNPDPVTPVFPASGQSSAWLCHGVNGGSSVTCDASRDLPIYQLIIETEGNGIVSVPGLNIDCQKRCTHQLEEGTKLNLKAIPNADYSFLGWGLACAGTSTTCDVIIDSDVNVKAEFTDVQNGIDTDKDGLLDVWEKYGYLADNGHFVDFPSLGAKPDHKDIFVEVDYMEGRKLHPKAIQALKDAFNKAPIDNPNGKKGIKLHIIEDDVLPLEKATIPETLEDFKRDHFSVGAEGVFHYAVIVDKLDSPEGFIGQAFGSDFIVSFKEDYKEIETASVFMHELGHTLGLEHGGDEYQNFKPNYFSVMNYSYSTGIPSNNGIKVIDYSRCKTELNEEKLKENIDLSTLNCSNGFHITHYCYTNKDCDTLMKSHARENDFWLFAVSSGFEYGTCRAGDHVNHRNEGLVVPVSPCPRSGSLEETVQAFQAGIGIG